MDTAATRGRGAVKVSTLLELGRVSNLPTVWSNVLCGAVLGVRAPGPGSRSGSGSGSATLALLVVAGSLFYVGGMLLNDAFDAEIDRRERPERPIPSGRVSRAEVFNVGFLLLGLGLVLLGGVVASGRSPSGPRLLGAGVATTIAIVVYDRWHKGHAWSPVVMGLCRAGLYLTAALGVSPDLSLDVWLAASALALYVVGLTHIARFETASFVARAWPTAFVLAPSGLAVFWMLGHRTGIVGTIWPLLLVALSVGWAAWAVARALAGGKGDIPRAVGALIAGISLCDATFIAARGAVLLSLLALGAFALTLRLQRRIAGT